MSTKKQDVLVRGQILHYLTDPGPGDDPAAWEYFDDGALWIVDGHVQTVGPWAAVTANLAPQIREAASFHDHRGKLVLPGLVDTHIHYPQAGVIGSFGWQLLDWLNKHTFPTQQKYSDKEFARSVAKIFLQESLRNGITSGCVYCTVYPQSVDALFEEAEKPKVGVVSSNLIARSREIHDPMVFVRAGKPVFRKWSTCSHEISVPGYPADP